MMRRSIDIDATVECPYSAVADGTQRFFHDRMHRSGGFALNLVVPFERGPLAIGRTVAVRISVVTEVGNPYHRHEHEVWMRFEPVAGLLFPKFRARLTVTPEGLRTHLHLTSTYRVPGGSLGAVFDAFAGRVIARRIMARLLRDLKLDLERQHALFLQATAAMIKGSFAAAPDRAAYELHR